MTAPFEFPSFQFTMPAFGLPTLPLPEVSFPELDVRAWVEALLDGSYDGHACSPGCVLHNPPRCSCP